MIAHLQAREKALAAEGWTGREAEWIALVCLHSGVFTRAQFGFYVEAGASRKPAERFVRILVARGAAVEDVRPIFPGGSRAVHIVNKKIYRALGIENIRHRRGAKETKMAILLRRLLSLDYVIERPGLAWLPTEDEKVRRFDALGVDRTVLPFRTYGADGKEQKRFFALKLPVAVEPETATFGYVDPGRTTDSELRKWGNAHRKLWAALRARSFAVHVVAIGTDTQAANRAETVLRHWTSGRREQAEGNAAGLTQADPDIKEEMARLRHAILSNDERLFATYGGVSETDARYSALRKLPAGTEDRAARLTTL